MQRRLVKTGCVRGFHHARPIAWEPPADGWVKVNTGGALKRGVGRSTAGGIIRDTYGTWLRGLPYNLGCTSVMAAELWALWPGSS